MCGQQTGTSMEGLLRVLGNEIGEWRGVLRGPVPLVEEIQCMGTDASEKREGRREERTS